LTGLQFRIMEAITQERIHNSLLLDLVKCYYILGKAARAIEGKQSFKIKGLVGYLLEMEKIKDSDFQGAHLS